MIHIQTSLTVLGFLPSAKAELYQLLELLLEFVMKINRNKSLLSYSLLDLNL